MPHPWDHEFCQISYYSPATGEEIKSNPLGRLDAQESCVSARNFLNLERVDNWKEMKGGFCDENCLPEVTGRLGQEQYVLCKRVHCFRTEMSNGGFFENAVNKMARLLIK